ncbi:glycosyl transferase family 1 [Bacillus sp. 17376]|uniref:Glycosyltransferase n=1 Tax=Mesobacillus boroniphilus JCM 21738 TaxID=1294265 RepID=W4RJM6_9BACI|nr:glycosyltransferase [Mesobacillus boroniphilus]ESU34217.1 glycosyl transferase family 1 [Bacillus sp. 17376]GAE44083.1 glycosyltransferase [Mesobacillus boroniphilus JCM 21738]
MRILLLAPGKSIHTHKWALFYKSVNVDVKVVTFADHHSEENAKEVDTEILTKMLPGKLSYLSGVFALKKIIKEFKPDILHAHYVSSYGFVGALANFHPYYVSVWGRDIFQFPQMGKMNESIVKYTLDKADVICSTSHIMAKETNKYTSKNVFVTPFGVNIDKFQPNGSLKEDGVLTIGTVKALSDKYGIADLIQAFALINQKYQESNLLIVGDGPQKKEYEELTERLGIGHATTFTGRVPNDKVPDYINKMSIFAVPSTEDSESFGVAAVEAMACGVPPVVSNVGGLPEVVIEGKTGFVVPKENPEKLSEAMLKLIEDQEMRQRMATNGVVHVKQHYNWIDNANGMLELYSQTLEKGMRS